MTKFTAQFDVDDELWATLLNVSAAEAPGHLRDLVARNADRDNLGTFLRNLLGYGRDFVVQVGPSASRTPHGGDAVRLAVPHPMWDNVEVGDIGVIQGLVGKTPVEQAASIVFHHVTFRGCGHPPYDGLERLVVQSAGAPVTRLTSFADLRPTGDIVPLKVWRYSDDRQSYWYTVQALVWDWYPGDTPLS